MAQVDFGTYHHSTPEESERIRQYAEMAFSMLLPPLFPTTRALRVLDAGCGLGFLMYVIAKSFPKASITGVDLFRSGSMSQISMEKAVQNMKSLRLDSRTSFLKHDLTKPLNTAMRHDLVVSNLVFHNMGQKRFTAYGMVFDTLKSRGYFVIGDLFERSKSDVDYFNQRSELVGELDGSGIGTREYKVKLLRKTC